MRAGPTMNNLFLTILGAFSFLAVSKVDAQLLITGVVDGTLPGGLPKAVELFALTAIPDLGIYGIGSANNGGGSDGNEFALSGSATMGQFLYVASESTEFSNFFGFAPDFTNSAANINGDDAIELFESGSVIDTFGEINVDGTGEPWEYSNGWAYRNSGTSAGAFDLADWSFSGTNALNGATTTNAAASNPFPIGTFTTATVSTPTSTPVSTPTTSPTTSPTLPPPPVVTIMDIQASQQVPLPLSLTSGPVSLVSPLLGQRVQTSGVVSHVTSNTIFFQDPVGDGDDTTSDAMTIFDPNQAASFMPGDLITVIGTVAEFFPGGQSSRNQPTTQFAFPTITLESSGNPLPAPVLIGKGGRVPPSQSMVDALNFFESLEAMLVTAQKPLAIAGTNRFGETFTVVDLGKGATGLSERGTLNISPLDFNPEKVQIQGGGLEVDTGAKLRDVIGVIGYSFGNYEILPTQPISVLEESEIVPVVTHLDLDEDCISLSTYNVLNLDPNDNEMQSADTDVANGRFEAVATHIVTNMLSPDIVALQEVQDNNGSDNDGTIEASLTLQFLVDAIVAAGGPSYQFQDNPFIGDNQSGGQPGGNIRTAYLYNPSRVSLLEVEQLSCQDSGCAFEGARLPLVAKWESKGNRILTTVNVHFSSKGGSAPIVGVEQPFERRQEDANINGSLDERLLQASAVRGYVQNLLNEDDSASVVVLGDFNEFEFVSPLVLLGLTNLAVEEYDEDEIYTFIFQGNSQALDHILVSPALSGKKSEVELIHVNSEFADSPFKASDHDPILAQVCPPDTIVCEGRQVFCSDDNNMRGGKRGGVRRKKRKVAVCVSRDDSQESLCVDADDEMFTYKYEYTCGCCAGDEELCM